jgi:hypothetical protein
MTKNVSILLESSKDLKVAESLFGKDQIASCAVTSPFLIETLKGGYDTIRLEKAIPVDKQLNIVETATRCADNLASRVDALCATESNGLSLGSALRIQFQSLLNLLIYKAELLRCWREDLPGSIELHVAGDQRLTPVNSFSIGQGRFDAIFSALAGSSSLANKFKVFATVPQTQEPVENRNEYPRLERLLGACNRSLNSWRFSWWLRREQRRFNNCLALPEPAEIAVFKRCELLEEAVCELIKAGKGPVDYWPYQGMLFEPAKGSIPEYYVPDGVLNSIDQPINDFFKGEKRYLKAIRSLFDARLRKALAYGIILSRDIPDRLTQISPKPPKVFISNSLVRPAEQLLSEHLNRVGTEIISFEHGVTAGIEAGAEYMHARGALTSKHETVICFNEPAKRCYESNGVAKKGIVSGAPEAVKDIRLKFLQRMLCRHALGFKSSDRAILYLPLATRNNLLFASRCENDLQYYNFNKTLIDDVFAKVSDPVLMKLYPSDQYSDADPFAKHVVRPDNVRTLKYFDFSRLRALPDLIILNSCQSTMGYVLSTDKPTVLVEMPISPFHPEIADLLNESLFTISAIEDGWINRLISLLTLPQENINEMWRGKQEARGRLKEVIFGPKGNSGLKAVGYISNIVK